MGNIPINLPARIRLAVYLVTGVGTIAVGYLFSKHLIGDAEATLWAGISALVNGLSAVNVNTNE